MAPRNAFRRCRCWQCLTLLSVPLQCRCARSNLHRPRDGPCRHHRSATNADSCKRMMSFACVKGHHLSAELSFLSFLDTGTRVSPSCDVSRLPQMFSRNWPFMHGHVASFMHQEASLLAATSDVWLASRQLRHRNGWTWSRTTASIARLSHP